MKSLTIIFKIDKIERYDELSHIINCTTIKSYLTKNGGTKYSFRMSNEDSDALQAGDIIKTVTLVDKIPETDEDFKNMKPVGRRVETIKSGEDLWSLVFEEFYS